MAYKDFAPAQILTAQEVDTYLMRQTIMSFATSTARDAAITTPVEGMVAYLEDSNTFWFYNGSAWQNLGNVMLFASAATRTSALPSPVEGMVSYLQDTDELQVYNGASWLTLVVTSDDETISTTGAVQADTNGADGGLVMRSWTANPAFTSLATRNMASAEYNLITNGTDTFIGAGSGGTVFLRPSANSVTGQVSIDQTNTTTAGNLVVSKRNPVLQIEETGGADNVDINLYQAGSSTEGLQIRYESGTGHSRIKNIYSAGDLYLHSANNTGTGLRIASNGFTYNNLGDTYTNSGQMIGSARLVAQGYTQTSSNFNVGAAWVTLLGFTVNPALFGASWLGVHFEYSCYMNGTGAHRSRILVDRGGTYSVYERYRYFNTAYQHQQWAQNQITNVPNSGGNYTIYCQVWGGTTISFDGNDSYGFVAYTA